MFTNSVEYEGFKAFCEAEGGSDLKSEEDAWRIALGWPDEEEIEDAKAHWVFAVKARLDYSKS